VLPPEHLLKHITIKLGSIQELPVTQAPSTTIVLVIGGAYAGSAASLNLFDLCDGRVARFSTNPEVKSTSPLPVEIKIVDERDGYCKLSAWPYFQMRKRILTTSSQIISYPYPSASHLGTLCPKLR